MADDSQAPKSGIPAWQRAAQPQSNEQPGTPVAAESNATEEPAAAATSEDSARDSHSSPDVKDPDHQAPLLEHAKKFLEDEAVSKAPQETKVAFLESKGLTKEDIAKAIELFKEEEPISASPASAVTPSAQLLPHGSAQVPPIITYPEFLLRAQKQPPLVTTTRLINTAYVASGIAAVIYGLSHYLIGPMTDSLTAARREFAENTRTRIEELNERLAEAVSVDPATKQPSISHREAAGDDKASDAGTMDSDPTELFHRDFGTQTSPALEDAKKPVVGSDSESSSTETQSDAATRSTTQLHSLESHFKVLIEENANEGWTTQQVTSNIEALKTYLDGLVYPTYSYNSTYNVGDSKKEEDEIGRMKAEIRGVKGSLLSARNFPSGGRRSYWPAAGDAS